MRPIMPFCVEPGGDFGIKYAHDPSQRAIRDRPACSSFPQHPRVRVRRARSAVHWSGFGSAMRRMQSWRKGERVLHAAFKDERRHPFARLLREGICFPGDQHRYLRFPRDRAATIAVAEVRRQLSEKHSIRQVTFCCFDSAMLGSYQRLLTD